MKALSILLYTLGNASFGMIGRLLNVSNVAVLKWVRKEAKSLRPVVPSDLKLVQIDEMWHYVNGENKIWIWKTFDPVSGRVVSWPLGRGDDRTAKRLID